MKRKFGKILSAFIAILLLGFILPEPRVMPVVGASSNDWNKDTFWYEPWGSSGVHKGIDIFAAKGTDLVSTNAGLVVYQGSLRKGGNVVVLLGPKWRVHYYAHLDSTKADAFSWVSAGQSIGSVGDSGNAKGKPAHIHYSIVTLIPYLWRVDFDSQGYKKIFYLDSGAYLSDRIKS